MTETEPIALDRTTRDDIIEIINEVESDVLSEDKFGATRDMIVEGTCERIRGSIYSRPVSPVEDGDTVQCVLCDESSETIEDHEQHMEEIHA